MEPAGADEAAEASAVAVTQAQVLAPLFAIGVFGCGQDRQGHAVGVKGLVVLELAIGRGRVQTQRRTQVEAGQPRHAPDLPVQTQSLAAVKGRARRQGSAVPRILAAQHCARRRVGGEIGDGLERRAGRLVRLIVGDHVEPHRLRRRPCARQAEGLGFDGVVVVAAQQILDEAVARLHARGQTQARRLADRQIHRPLDHAIAFIADLGLGIGFGAADAGAVLDQIHRADQGAATVQGRLRPLGDLDPLHVEQFDIGAA